MEKEASFFKKIECPTCHNEFTQTLTRQDFCSIYCQRKYWRKIPKNKEKISMFSYEQ